jgi:CBS domain-containing protein
MTVKDVMTKRVATCRPETNLAEATALMWENDCGALPVLAETGELAGIVTDRDICIALGTRNVRSSDLCVRDVVNNHPRICKSSDDIHAALQAMRDGKIRRLPVVSDSASLEGIVSMDDVVLNAAHGNGKLDRGVSYGDVVTTLQAIYVHDDQLRGRSTAA